MNVCCEAGLTSMHYNAAGLDLNPTAERRRRSFGQVA